MTYAFTGRTALITGASRGINLAIGKRLSEGGAKVMLTSRKLEGLQMAAAELPSETAVRAANAGDPQQAKECVRACIELWGRLDILVNGAGTNPHAGPVIDMPLTAWDKTFTVNLRGPLVWTQEAWRQWMREHGGCVINISSNSAYLSGGPIGAYQITKAGVISLTRHLASELGPGVRVNAVAPGMVQTEFSRMLWEPQGPDADFGWPLRRLGHPDDIASAAAWLASDEASWVTGTTLVVDGGFLTVASLRP